MKRRLSSLTTILLFSILQSFAFAQGDINNNPKKEDISFKDVPVLTFQKPDVESLLMEDSIRDKNGYYYRFGVGIPVDISPKNSGVWTTKENGDRVWRLRIKYPDAKALSFIFSKFQLHGDSRIDVYDEGKNRVHLTYTKRDVLETREQNMSICKGDFLMLRLVEPKGSPASELQMDKLFYAYRSNGGLGYEQKINESASCQVNVNCVPEGKEWQDEKRGVARILGYQGWSQLYCTGSLINNTDEDCKPYFLTAMHCVVDVSQSDLNKWRFYFNYEAPGCVNPINSSYVPSKYITGCKKISGSEDVDGDTIRKSDFCLLKIGSQTDENSTIQTLKSYNAYWNGWDANNVASSGGVGIHHPSGDIKKISAYTQTLTSTTYGGFIPNTHWKVYWVATTHGHGVTESGSSGSPIFNYNGGSSRIVGTLSGGSSYCNANYYPDIYGKMSYHWESDGTTPEKQLKPWLDSGNTGLKVLDGSSNPCGTTGEPDGPCVANSQTCDQYIARVKLKAIDNHTNCDYYTDYTSISAKIGYDTTYTVSVTSGTVASGVGTYNEGDVVGVWIDWNKDGDFLDMYETIGTESISGNSPILFDFVVPKGTASGSYIMRVRIDNDPDKLGAIDPCGTTEFGEIEDYRIIHQSNLGLNELSALNAVSIYPNPILNQVTVDLNSNYKTIDITVYDVTGRIVLTSTSQNEKVVNLDFSHLSAGLYQISIRTENGEIVRKLVKK